MPISTVPERVKASGKPSIAADSGAGNFQKGFADNGNRFVPGPEQDCAETQWRRKGQRHAIGKCTQVIGAGTDYGHAQPPCDQAADHIGCAGLILHAPLDLPDLEAPVDLEPEPRGGHVGDEALSGQITGVDNRPLRQPVTGGHHAIDIVVLDHHAFKGRVCRFHGGDAEIVILRHHPFHGIITGGDLHPGHRLGARGSEFADQIGGELQGYARRYHKAQPCMAELANGDGGLLDVLHAADSLTHFLDQQSRLFGRN